MDFERLFFLRENSGLSQQEMGKILKVGRVAISQWENTKEIIPLEKLNIYSNYFGVSLDYLAKLSNDKNKIKKITLDKVKIGKNLKKLRKKLSLTQEQLAKELNTTHSTISAYENGKTLLLTSFAFEICKKYNISLDWLCGKSNNKNIKIKLSIEQKSK